jgi:tRNA-splicing ligase RtcB (3'-phosphate/5'-hydroxy nucleic acid ligase)
MEQITKRLMSWASVLHDNARDQAVNTSRMPFVQPHVALMPDAHLGKGATVGSVIPTVGAIIPAAVGVDIGCGMVAVRSQFDVDELRARAASHHNGSLGPLRELIENAIPLSAGNHNQSLTPTAATRCRELAATATDEFGFNPADYARHWELQLGSLGSGNHFIEVTADEQKRVWLFLHSGSRGIGNRIAQHHIDIAKAWCKRWFIGLPDPDLAYLIEDTPEFDRYIAELTWAQSFAWANRAEMMDRTVDALGRFMGSPVDEAERIQCHHNYTQRERHLGRDVWLSRKGAIDAHTGVLGLIPGSMGTASYVVEGKGNVMSLCSAPHGAGREHSRSAARRAFTLDQLGAAMAGIEYRHTEAFIDEIPAAYKDIDQVMADAADLVSVRHTLRQLVNVKGD